MFILKRQDVEIGSFQHPSKDQKIPILSYQGQTFRLLSVFGAAQEEDARTLWRELTDNRGKACVLLEEPERFSVWGKVQMDWPLSDSSSSDGLSNSGIEPALVKGGLLILQAMYEDIEDLLGAKQAKSFENELIAAGQRLKLPHMTSADMVGKLLTVDPFSGALPAWGTSHLNELLSTLHQVGKNYFGRSNFTERVLGALDDLSLSERETFLSWLKQMSSGQLWQ